MIDGIDGQCAILVQIAIVAILLTTENIVDYNFFYILIAVFSGLTPFLIFNISYFIGEKILFQ